MILGLIILKPKLFSNETAQQIETATFGSITIRYIDEMDTVDEDGVAALSGQTPTSQNNIPADTSQEEESFPGF